MVIKLISVGFAGGQKVTEKITNKITISLKKTALLKLLFYPAIAMFLPLSTASIAEAKSLSEQRTEYRAAIKADDKKRYVEFKRLKADLKDYPLYPYLDYREFVRDLSAASLSRVKRFEERYQDMPFTRTLRARYLTLLGKRRDWRAFLAYQKEPPRDETLRCYYFHAKAQRGYRVEALKGAKEMYLTGKSVNRACDSLFSYLRKSGELTDELVLKRALLAFESRNPGLINYLSRQVSGENQAMVQSALRLYKAPTRVEHFAQISKITVFHQDLVSLALIKLARKNPDEAVRQFANTMKGQKVPESLRQEVGDYIAGRLMSTDDTSLRVWRDNVLNKSSDVKLLERRFRLAIAQGRFESAERWIDQLPDAEVDNLKWRYWKAVSPKSVATISRPINILKIFPDSEIFTASPHPST
ncbi:hypothetical protein [Veronia nyctiphanis]|uniref:hypothetical protein n=1 Tax=Veronia nyctiphanis TaxID=1278244 RepID=UPI001F3C742C|nr:hypothetical protein [Veronia nyctiphanis]